MIVHTPSPAICFLTTSLHPGGAERQVVDLAKELNRRGWSIAVVSMVAKGVLAQELEADSIPVKSLNMRPGVPNPRALLRFRHIVREHRPELIHSHMVHANLLARAARLLNFVPVCISTAHSINEGSRPREIAYRLTDNLAYATTIISRAAADRYLKIRAVSPRKLQVIPNGVDCEKFSPDSAIRARIRNELALGTQFTWIAVGRIEAVKDYPTMLRSFSVARLAHPEAVLLIAGDGELRSETERLAASLGLQSSVRFLGIRNDIPDLLNAADAVVLSSKWEGLPLVLLEAAACGLPVVATDVGGNSEIVCHGRTGFLVRPEDHIALASVMESMMNTVPEIRVGLGAEGRARVVECFGLDAIVSQWEELYRSAIAGRASLKSSTVGRYSQT